MTNIISVSYLLGVVGYLVLTLLLATAWRGRLQGGLLLAATTTSLLWCFAGALHAFAEVPSFEVVAAIEVARDGAWLAFLFNLFSAGRGVVASGTGLHRVRLAALSLFCFALIAHLLGLLDPLNPLESVESRTRLSAAGFVVLAVLGLILIEQLYRNTRVEFRWQIKFLCLGVGGLFAYDFFVYSDALLLGRIDLEAWAARGVVNALVVPLIAVSAARNPQWSLEIFVSRHIVLHSAAVLGAGAYLLVMAAAGYYIRSYGGSWGGIAQTVFLFGAIVLLLSLIFSGQLRSSAKRFLSKHFFRNKYDYRDEWLSFTRTLSNSEQDAELRENTIRAIAEIVESPGGAMWMHRQDSDFVVVAEQDFAAPAGAVEPVASGLSQFLRSTGRVIFIDEYEADPAAYDDVVLPDWLHGMRKAWVLVPLVNHDELIGFIVLARSSTNTGLNWEDSDLLNTVGRQAASYLAFLDASEALSQARQFEAFNRLSAFVVHDLKNVVAQLELIRANSAKHKNNPRFVDDVLATIANATAKMNRMLAQLSKEPLEETNTKLVNLAPLLEKVVQVRSIDQPTPALEMEDPQLFVRIDPDRLSSVVKHLVQNAQEATARNGRVVVRAGLDHDRVLIRVEDNGCGMTPEFIRQRLFRPFDTTKGNAGMGIGVYEAREFVTACGGTVEVDSEPGKGTVFRLRLPSEAQVGTEWQSATGT